MYHKEINQGSGSLEAMLHHPGCERKMGLEINIVMVVFFESWITKISIKTKIFQKNNARSVKFRTARNWVEILFDFHDIGLAASQLKSACGDYAETNLENWIKTKNNEFCSPRLVFHILPTVYIFRWEKGMVWFLLGNVEGRDGVVCGGWWQWCVYGICWMVFNEAFVLSFAGRWFEWRFLLAKRGLFGKAVICSGGGEFRACLIFEEFSRCYPWIHFISFNLKDFDGCRFICSYDKICGRTMGVEFIVIKNLLKCAMNESVQMSYSSWCIALAGSSCRASGCSSGKRSSWCNSPIVLSRELNSAVLLSRFLVSGRRNRFLRRMYAARARNARRKMTDPITMPTIPPVLTW